MANKTHKHARTHTQTHKHTNTQTLTLKKSGLRSIPSGSDLAPLDALNSPGQVAAALHSNGASAGLTAVGSHCCPCPPSKSSTQCCLRHANTCEGLITREGQAITGEGGGSQGRAKKKGYSSTHLQGRARQNYKGGRVITREGQKKGCAHTVFRAARWHKAVHTPFTRSPSQPKQAP